MTRHLGTASARDLHSFSCLRTSLLLRPWLVPAVGRVDVLCSKTRRTLPVGGDSATSDEDRSCWCSRLYSSLVMEAGKSRVEHSQPVYHSSASGSRGEWEIDAPPCGRDPLVRARARYCVRVFWRCLLLRAVRSATKRIEASICVIHEDVSSMSSVCKIMRSSSPLWVHSMCKCNPSESGPTDTLRKSVMIPFGGSFSWSWYTRRLPSSSNHCR